MPPKLSVITPALNQASFIHETLDTVAALPFAHEHIVIDAVSTDGTMEILAAREDPSLTWVSEPDRGQTDAVNKGLRRATGEYCGWINADDAYVPETVAKAVAHLDANPDVAALYGFMDIIDAEGAVIRNYRPAPFDFRRYLYLGDYVPTTAIIFRRALLDEIGFLDEQYKDAADYDFYLRMFHGRRIDRIAEPLIRFRFHDASKTAATPEVQLAEALAIRQKWAATPRHAAIMRGIDTAKQAVFKVANPWPPDKAVNRAADAVYRLRERLTSSSS